MTSTGYSAITGYKLYWDNATGTIITTPVLTTGPSTFTATLSTTEGETYLFKISAINVLGEGSLSDVTEIISATIPDAPAQPTKVDATLTSI